MLRYALQRFYVALIALLVLSLPLFALIRVPFHNKNVCDLMLTAQCEGNPPMVLTRNGPLYEIWQTGTPPNDWWPIAVALLAAERGVQLALSRRRAASD